jgi:hypothetical protein
MRISASFVNNFSKYRGALPSINGTSSPTYAYNKEGYDYPNYSGAALIDYSISNSLLLSVRGGYAMSDTRNQQIAPQGTSWYFSYSNYIYQNDPYFQANPDMLHYAGWQNSSMWQQTLRYKLEKYSGNADLTYYVNLGGEHAWKMGVQIIRDQEDVARVAPYPRVTLQWGRGYYGLATGEPVLGKYGNYQIRSGWTSIYGWNWDIYRNDRQQADHQRRYPDRERVYPRLHERPERRGRLAETDPVRLRRQVRAPSRRRL